MEPQSSLASSRRQFDSHLSHIAGKTRFFSAKLSLPARSLLLAGEIGQLITVMNP
jgi:hypothetical protein